MLPESLKSEGAHAASNGLHPCHLTFGECCQLLLPRRGREYQELILSPDAPRTRPDFVSALYKLRYSQPWLRCFPSDVYADYVDVFAYRPSEDRSVLDLPAGARFALRRLFENQVRAIAEGDQIRRELGGIISTADPTSQYAVGLALRPVLLDICDEAGSRQLSRGQLKSAFFGSGISVTSDELDVLLQRFDPWNLNKVDVLNLIAELVPRH